MDKRKANVDWVVTNSEGQVTDWAQVQVAVLMDIRDELRKANVALAALRCPNFLDIPRKLDRIRVNTAKRRKKRAKKTGN